MHVLFTQQAQRQIEAGLAPGIARVIGTSSITSENADQRVRETRDSTFKQLRDILAKTFEAEAVVVYRLMNGYRRKEDSFILLVEVFDPVDAAIYVVKIAPDVDAKKELASWNCCRPVGLSHDFVLLPLSSGTSAPINGLSSIFYGAAQQLIGVEQIIPLEEAAIQSVLYGSPTLTSIDSVLSDLYERFGHLLYVHSVEQFVSDDPSHFILDVPKLSESIRLWEVEPQRSLRSVVVSSLQEFIGPSHFTDPVDYIKYIRKFVPWRDVDEKVNAVQPLGNEAWRTSIPIPRAEQVVPRMMRGRAHGDLHGRNVLVGMVHGRAVWPTVFDYENMGLRNYVGWDFVKLETELKIRIYPWLFPVPLTNPSEGGRSARLFTEEVQAFEERLNARTEHCRANNSWPSLRDIEQTPKQRLLWLLLRLRQRAHLHLGVDIGRPRLWLEEYYFLLMCYGICSVRFDNLQDKDRAAAFISAGVACSRLIWYRDFASRLRSPLAKELTA